MTDKLIENMSVAEIEHLLQQRKSAEHEQKKEELNSARAKVKELEAFFKNGTKVPRGRKPGVKREAKKPRAKRGDLRGTVLTFLGKGEAPLKKIVEAVNGNYGTVAQLVAKLKKEKVITQGAGRGAPYAIAK